MPPEVASRILARTLGCIQETNIGSSIFSIVKNQEYSNDDVMKNFFLCAFKKNEVADDDGEILVEEILTYYPDTVDKDTIRTVIEDCKKDGGDKPNEKVFAFFKCYQNKTPVHFALSDKEKK